MNFNTSHVTVYLQRAIPQGKRVKISIHPMLRFIKVSMFLLVWQRNFNTSHVTVYRHCSRKRHQTISYFNTSHVTVYHARNAEIVIRTKISIHPMLRFIKMRLPKPYSGRYFNTSHVTVYLETINDLDHDVDFNTSHVTVYLHLPKIKEMLFINFNTSHVTVYRSNSPEPSVHLWNFNTSHVTVYLMILSHSYLGIFHHFLYSTSFQHFLPADYKI